MLDGCVFLLTSEPRAHGERLEGVAARKGVELEHHVLDRAVGRRAVVVVLAEHKLAELGQADDGREVVVVLGAVDAAARAVAGDLRLFALDSVEGARVELAGRVLDVAPGVGEGLEFEALAPARTRRARAGSRGRAMRCSRLEEVLVGHGLDRSGRAQVVVVVRVVGLLALLGLVARHSAPVARMRR